MVLTQPASWIYPGAGVEFPYHYGSHATSLQVQESGGAPAVSIPLWFSRNPLFRPLQRVDRNCFHTTMVLTQLSLGGGHMEKKLVSIPLWFSRNASQSHQAR